MNVANTNGDNEGKDSSTIQSEHDNAPTVAILRDEQSTDGLSVCPYKRLLFLS
jgi:hypothetical protein